MSQQSEPLDVNVFIISDCKPANHAPIPFMVLYAAMNDLTGRCLAAYWHDRNALIDDHSRMRAVAEVLAEEIRQWAPPKEQAKICFLAINEVADRLLRDTNCHDSRTS